MLRARHPLCNARYLKMCCVKDIESIWEDEGFGSSGRFGCCVVLFYCGSVSWMDGCVWLCLSCR